MHNDANQETVKMASARCSPTNYNLGSHTNPDAPAILPTATATTMCGRETKETKTKEEGAPIRMWRGRAVSRYTSA